MSHDTREYIKKLSALLDAETSFVTITLLDIRGSAPQIVGAKAIVTAEGIQYGTVGGGKIEAAAIKHAQELLNTTDSQACELKTWNLQTDIGMTCGGEVKLFFDVHASHAWPIVVYGAGHVAQSLIPLLVQLHCHVTCIDSRSDWLAKLPDHPKLRKRCLEVPKESVVEQPADAFFVLISKGHATDMPVLAEILKTRDAPYLGVIGSKQKASVLRRELKAQNVATEKIDSFLCPIGMPIGNNTPIEIAVSITAQLVQVRESLRE